MIDLLIAFIISLMAAYGIAVLLVEKGEDYPMNKITSRLRFLIFWWIGPEASDVLDCTVCASFWTALITDCVLAYVAFTYFNVVYFLWPLTGFAAAGITWTIIQFLNAIDPDSEDGYVEE